jgi:hypothetical protein
MKRFSVIAAAMMLAAPVFAAPADHLIGTWECQVAGAPVTTTPPIVWFGEAHSEGKRIETVVDLDAFAGAATGVADLASTGNGWWKVQPQDGESFLIKPVSPYGKDGKGAMLVKMGQSSYDCRRLKRVI